MRSFNIFKPKKTKIQNLKKFEIKTKKTNIENLIEKFEKINRKVKQFVEIVNNEVAADLSDPSLKQKINELNRNIDILNSRLPYIKDSKPSNLEDIFDENSPLDLKYLYSEYGKIYKSYFNFCRNDLTPEIEQEFKVLKLKINVKKLLTGKLLEDDVDLYKEIENFLKEINNFHLYLHNITNPTHEYNEYLNTFKKLKKLTTDIKIQETASQNKPSQSKGKEKEKPNHKKETSSKQGLFFNKGKGKGKEKIKKNVPRGIRNER